MDKRGRNYILNEFNSCGLWDEGNFYQFYHFTKNFQDDLGKEIPYISFVLENFQALNFPELNRKIVHFY